MKAHWPAGLAQFTPTAPLQLASGAQLEAATVGYQTWGKLNSAGDNAIWVCHALTGTSDVAAWWPGLFGAGRVLDPQRNFIVCSAAVMAAPARFHSSQAPAKLGAGISRP